MPPPDQQTTFNTDIYTGFWLNSSHGATLTINRRNGGLLIAFLALYISMTGTSFWKIARFALHAGFSERKGMGGMYHQRQAVLRNARAAGDAVGDVLGVLFARRRQVRRADAGLMRWLVVVVVAGYVALGSAVAGVFASRLTSGDEVLLSGRMCANNLRSEDTLPQYLTVLRKMRERSLAYARSCYQDPWDNGLPQICQRYTKTRLAYTVDSDAGCPFDDEVCLQDSGNIALDSGFVDSRLDLGVNGETRFLLRYKSHCAPLKTQGYSEVYNDAQTPTGKVMRYKYGRFNIPGNGDTGATNDSHVYQIPVKDLSYLKSVGSLRQWPAGEYALAGMHTLRGDKNIFTPITELDLPDSIVSLLFLSSQGVISDQPIEDPWFNATLLVASVVDASNASNTAQLYTSSEPASVLGCATQIDMCNPALPEGSRCVNVNGPVDRLAEIWQHPEDLLAAKGYLTLLNSSVGGAVPRPDWIYGTHGPTALLAKSTQLEHMQIGRLPADQWQLEMEFGFQAVLASIQSAVVEASIYGLYYNSTDPCGACEMMCGSQKIKSTAFYSVSVLGVSLVLFLGLAVMIIATFLESLVQLALKIFHAKDGRLTYAWLEWQSNSFLQLQRLAHEGVGMGTWSGAVDSVPVNRPGELLGMLDISDVKHPRLQHAKPSIELASLDTRAAGATAHRYFDGDSWRDDVSYDPASPRHSDTSHMLPDDSRLASGDHRAALAERSPSLNSTMVPAGYGISSSEEELLRF